MTTPPKRRRAERKSEAEHIDRSWDSPEAAQFFEDSRDPKDPKQHDDVVVIFDDAEAEDDTSPELDKDFWEAERPPHY